MKYIKLFTESLYKNNEYYEVIDWDIFDKNIDLEFNLKDIIEITDFFNKNNINYHFYSRNLRKSYFPEHNNFREWTNNHQVDIIFCDHGWTMHICYSKDEYFLVDIGLTNESNIYYKCDQIEGFKMLIENKNEWINNEIC